MARAWWPEAFSEGRSGMCGEDLPCTWAGPFDVNGTAHASVEDTSRNTRGGCSCAGFLNGIIRSMLAYVLYNRDSEHERPAADLVKRLGDERVEAQHV